MTFSITGETNYAAQVVRVHKFELPGLDNLRGIKVGGYTALISKDVPDGSLLAVFPAESQLSEGFASRNNLFRHSEKNADPTQTGYLEDNRRIRALKLRGHVSSALALSVDVFDTELSEGDVFDTVNGEVVSQKYYVKPPVTAQAKTQAKIWRRVEDKFLPEHIDTENYWRNAHKIPDDAFITVTQKLHGCFPAGTKVSMWDGTQKPIQKIVVGDELVGFDLDHNPVKSVAVTDAFTTGQTEEWVKLKLEQPYKGDKPTLILTSDHEILTPEGYVPASHLGVGDKVYHTKTYPAVTVEKGEVLTGIMLGDGSVAGSNRNSVEWSHKSEHVEYVRYVKDLLGNLSGKGKTRTRQSGFGTEMSGERTQALPTIRNFVRDWDRKIPDEIKLTPMVLAIWYMDDGSLSHHFKQQDRAEIATCSFTDEQIETLRKSLTDYGFTNFTFYQSQNRNGLSDRAYWRLRLNKDDAEKLFKDIRHLVPPVMQYKLPEKHRGYFVMPEVRDDVEPVTEVTTVLSSEVVGAGDLKLSTKWDIETSTHNFVAQRIAVHNSSLRASRTYVKVKPRLRDKVARWFGVRTTDTELDAVFGSRKVIKDPNNPNQQHFYDKDLWTEFGLSIADRIPPGVVVYGELIGWASETSPIQTNYTYNVQQGYQKLYVYRVAVITPDAHLYDLPWNAVKQFAIERGWNYVPELWSGSHKDFDVDSWMDKTYYPTHPNAVPLSKDSPVDEGVVVRWDGGFTPTVLKAKSPDFFLHETKLLDKGEEGLS